MKLAEMFIAGGPIPQPRPRITVRGRHGVAYVQKGHAIHAWRKKIADRMRHEMGTCSPFSGVGLHVVMEFYLPQPASNKKAIPISRPDLDNLVKAVLDAGNGVIWRDDSQVTTLETSKRWHDKPGVWLQVSGDRP